VLRAVLKAADLCATAPARVARRLVDRSFTDRYGDALQMLNDLPYEAGMIKPDPKRIIADSTDWRFLNELKRELKA